MTSRIPRGVDNTLGLATEAVWLAGYRVIRDPATGALAASFAHTRPLRVRPVATPTIRGTASGTHGHGAAADSPPAAPDAT